MVASALGLFATGFLYGMHWGIRFYGVCAQGKSHGFALYINQQTVICWNECDVILLTFDLRRAVTLIPLSFLPLLSRLYCSRINHCPTEHACFSSQVLQRLDFTPYQSHLHAEPNQTRPLPFLQDQRDEDRWLSPARRKAKRLCIFAVSRTCNGAIIFGDTKNRA